MFSTFTKCMGFTGPTALVQLTRYLACIAAYDVAVTPFVCRRCSSDYACLAVSALIVVAAVCIDKVTYGAWCLSVCKA